MHAARREEADLLVADEPRSGLGGVARVGILGQNDDQPAADLLMERREHERQHRLRHAGARGQRGGELGEPLLRAEAFDEAVEHRTVHDVRPNLAFGRVVMVRVRLRAAVSELRRSGPSTSR